MQLSSKAFAMARIVPHPTIGDYTVRPLIPSDVEYVKTNWLEAYYDSQDHLGVELDAYMDGQSKLIGHIATMAEVWVAELAGAPIGFLVGSKPSSSEVILHFIYVDAPYRRQGIGQCLLRCLGWKRNSKIVASHVTRMGERILKSNKKFKVAYNPYVAYFKF